MWEVGGGDVGMELGCLYLVVWVGVREGEVR